MSIGDIFRLTEWIVDEYLPSKSIDIEYDVSNLKGLKSKEKTEYLMDLVMDHESDEIGETSKGVSLLLAIEAQGLKLDEYRQVIYFFINDICYKVGFNAESPDLVASNCLQEIVDKIVELS